MLHIGIAVLAMLELEIELPGNSHDLKEDGVKVQSGAGITSGAVDDGKAEKLELPGLEEAEDRRS